MRVLVVSDAWHPQLNGVVRTYEGLGRHLRAAGHEFRVIGPDDFPHCVSMPGYAEIKLVINPGKRLQSLIDDFNPETIHIATEGPLGWAARRLCRRRKWPFTTAYHTQFPDYAALRARAIIPGLYHPVRNLGIWLVKTFHGPSSAVMTSTGSIERELIGWKLRAPLHRLTRGIDPSVFYPDEARKNEGINNNPVALYVGRVAIEKNLEAFLQMRWQGKKVIVGDGPALAGFQDRYPETLFLGRKTGQALADCYRSADVFVFPSKTDTFGIVLIEALACGIPIAAYTVPGPMDIVTEQGLGILNDDLASAAEGCLQLADDRDSRIRYVQEHYTWDAAMRQFLDGQSKALIPQTESL